MDIRSASLEAHRKWKGKIAVSPVAHVKNREELALAYTPGVAEPCLAIQKDPALSYELTRRWNTVAVVTDGTAVLGLGDIGPLAGMPVMEGKALLFREFAGIDAFPICIDSKDPDEIIKTVRLISGSFGGINLEDISAPRCFEIERRLREECDIPVFHDDQHGTAIVVYAALKNALLLAEKKIGDVKIVINGAGSAGIAIGTHLAANGAKNIVYVDLCGALTPGVPGMNAAQAAIAETSNPNRESGTLSDVLAGADVFIGVSKPGLLTGEMIGTMAEKPIVFAMANPTPEIMPEEALAAGAFIVGTGRSDYANQINNLLAFPGIFRGALDCRASDINAAMKNAASEATASVVGEDLARDHILPSPFDPRVVAAVSAAVQKAAAESGVARI